MGRSKIELQKALELYDKALQGGADACIKIWEFMQEGNADTKGGANNGENEQRGN